MIEGLSDTALLRIGIGLAALILFLVILYSSRNRPGQGRRVALARSGDGDPRVEPTLREIIESEHQQQERARQPALDLHEAAPTGELPASAARGVLPGLRPVADFDKIVSVYLVARAGQSLSGPDLVVAAEKAGLVYGHMNVFHRLRIGLPPLRRWRRRIAGRPGPR